MIRQEQIAVFEELLRWANAYIRPRGVDAKAVCVEAQQALAALKKETQ